MLYLQDAENLFDEATSDAVSGTWMRRWTTSAASRSADDRGRHRPSRAQRSSEYLPYSDPHHKQMTCLDLASDVAKTM